MYVGRRVIRRGRGGLTEGKEKAEKCVGVGGGER